MQAYIVRRILVSIPVVALVAIFTFSILYIAPGDAASMDLFHTGGGMSWGGISPLLNSSISKDTYWNKYQDPSGQFTAKLEEFARSDAARQDELIKELQVIFFQDLQYLPIGESFVVWGMRKELKGVKETLLMSSGANYINAWLDN